MRRGRNPFKGVKIKFSPQEVTVVVATCIPHFEGYFKGKFDALKLCLGSIWKNTDLPYDLMVVDNGSTSEVTEYLLHLKDKNLIQYLMLNDRNLGKFNALNISFSSAPGKYIAYSDDDCFYYPNWLSSHIEIFETFPNVGIVSGKYISSEHLTRETLKTIKKNGWKMTRFIVPDEWNEEWAVGLGDDPKEFLKKPDIVNCKTYLVEKDGVKVFPGGCGFQFMTRKEVIQKFIPMRYDAYVGGEDYQLHKAIDEAGYLRLVTSGKYSMHIGNVVTEYWIEEAKRHGISIADTDIAPISKNQNGKPWYVKNKIAFRILKKIYDKIFKLLYLVK